MDNEDGWETIEESIKSMVKMGLLVDSGHRRWSERTGRYEIAWKLSPTCNGGYDSEDCLCLGLEVESLAYECPAKLKR